MKPSLIIVGLGNPGKSYERTRHNAGFQALDTLAESFGEGEWKDAPKFQAEVKEARVLTAPILLVKPRTYMNLSGESIRKLVDFYKLNPKEQLLVLSDDIDIPLGELRFRQKGGPGTHNGLKSVNLLYGEDYPRIRIGLGPKPDQMDLAAWVLSVPPPEQQELLEVVLKQIPDMVRKYVLGEM